MHPVKKIPTNAQMMFVQTMYSRKANQFWSVIFNT